MIFSMIGLRECVTTPLAFELAIGMEHSTAIGMEQVRKKEEVYHSFNLLQIITSAHYATFVTKIASLYNPLDACLTSISNHSASVMSLLSFLVLL